MSKETRKYIEQIANLVTLIIFGLFAYDSFYELFIFEPGVHYPRVEIDQSYRVEFTLNTPTITSFLILLASFVGLYAFIMISITKFFGTDKSTIKYWIIHATCILICSLSLIVNWIHFLGTAFDGVG